METEIQYHREMMEWIGGGLIKSCGPGWVCIPKQGILKLKGLVSKLLQ